MTGGGPIGAGFALRHPARVARVILLDSLLPPGLGHEWPLLAANLQESSWFRRARAAHASGTLEEILGNARYTVTHLMLELQGSSMRGCSIQCGFEPTESPSPDRGEPGGECRALLSGG